MSLLQEKIDPFCAFTINLGPLYVERVLDSLLTRQGVCGVARMPAMDRLQRYLPLLHQHCRHSSRRQYPFLQFYLGHFSQQLAVQPGAQEDSRHLLEKAICHYENYLELSDDTSEGRFYAQWQSALLQAQLGYSWPPTEAALLKAEGVDPLRGEPLAQLVSHYCQIKSWKAAYALSGLALRHYFDKNPVASRRWFVDCRAYDWHLLRTHLQVCYKSGHWVESKQTYQHLLHCACRHPDELDDADIRMIRGLERAVQINNAQSARFSAP